MSFIHPKSCECVKTELDLFSLPPTQTSIDSGKWIHFKPVSSLTNDAPIEFVVPGHGEEYTDLSQTMLYIVASIHKEDGTDLVAADTDVAPVNNWMHSLFSQVDVYMNQKLVSPQNNTYPYRTYIENLLNYGSDAKVSHLTGVLWYADTAGQMETCAEVNTGFDRRRAYCAGSKGIEMLGRLHVDVCSQEKFLLNGVELRVRLVRSRDSFSVMSSAGKFKVHMKEASLLVRRCKINPGVLLAHSKTLESGTAKYPITRVEVKTFTLPTGVMSKTLDSVFLGQLPKRIIVGMVSNQAFNGDFKKNPFYFQHYKMNYFALYVDGEQIPSKPLQIDMKSTYGSQYLMAYQTLFSGTGVHFGNNSHLTSRSTFNNGYALMAFDLTPDLSASDSSYWNLVRNGNLRIEVGFEEALTASVNFIVYAEFDNVIEVDRHRNVAVDFSG